jgi:hypothetical protein
MNIISKSKAKTHLSLLCLLLSFASCQTVETEHYLIPKGFTGRVEIIFDQKNGAAIKYEKGKARVYEIPKSGILLTQFHYEGGWINHHYYYIDNSGKRTEMAIFDFKNKKDGTMDYPLSNKDSIGIFSDGTTGQATKEGAQFEFFFVTSYRGFDTMETYDHFNKRVSELTGIPL